MMVFGSWLPNRAQIRVTIALPEGIRPTLEVEYQSMLRWLSMFVQIIAAPSARTQSDVHKRRSGQFPVWTVWRDTIAVLVT